MDSAFKLDIRKERLAKSSEAKSFDNDEFRDSIATVDDDGKRIWIYPKKPSGRLHRWRIAVTVFLLALLFGGPFITIGGQPLLMLNVCERRFVILGQIFWPQDFVHLAMLLIIFFVFIILFTVVFGRIWCGWMCPQTLFMEMVFRKIEYLIEGDAPAQRRLNKEPWTLQKIGKKTLKHVIFIAISILIAHTVMAYIIGIEKTIAIVSHAPSENIAGFIGLIAFTGIFYGVYAKFREQACIAVCPYGRLQGVLLVKDSIVVAYDWLRGEPRGHLKKQKAETAEHGDCIDCHLCVHVCPTGIDIRNGTQMECVNCTACIDACDDVMVKIGKPKGLIRFASYNSIKNGVQNLLNGRVIGYSLVLVLLMSIVSFSLITRSEIETTILKVPGTLFQRDKEFVTNLYSIEFVNKTFETVSPVLKVESPNGAELVRVESNAIAVPAEGLSKSLYFIRMHQSVIEKSKTVVSIGVYLNDEKIETVHVKFIGPVRKK